MVYEGVNLQNIESHILRAYVDEYAYGGDSVSNTITDII